MNVEGKGKLGLTCLFWKKRWKCVLPIVGLGGKYKEISIQDRGGETSSFPTNISLTCFSFHYSIFSVDSMPPILDIILCMPQFFQVQIECESRFCACFNCCLGVKNKIHGNHGFMSGRWCCPSLALLHSLKPYWIETSNILLQFFLKSLKPWLKKRWIDVASGKAWLVD